MLLFVYPSACVLRYAVPVRLMRCRKRKRLLPLRRRPFPATERGRVAPVLFAVTPVANVPPSTQPLTDTVCFACRGASPCRSRLVPSRYRPGALAGKSRITQLFSYPVSSFIPSLPIRKVAFVALFYGANALPCAPPAPLVI